MWPPAGAVPVDVEGLYEAAAAAGYEYGPAFRGLRAAWLDGQDVCAEIALPEDAAAEAGLFGLHPALLDAALHAGWLASGADGAADGAGVRLPFAWTGVSLRSSGSSALRVRLRRDESGNLSLTAADPAGVPVITVGSLVGRAVDLAQLGAAGGRLADALFGVEWVSVPGAGGEVSPAGWAVLGDVIVLPGTVAYPDLAGLLEAGDGAAPEVVVVHAGMPGRCPARPRCRGRCGRRSRMRWPWSRGGWRLSAWRVRVWWW